jgi:hypothetical protein
MSTIPTTTTPRLSVVTLCLSVGVLAGCGSTQSPEPALSTGPAESSSTAPTSASPPATNPAPGTVNKSTGGYVGAYDEAFHAELSSYTGQQVSLTGEVGDLIRSRSAYELTHPTTPDLDPLLISAAYAAPDLQIGDTVTVTGTLREGFEPPVVEEAVDGGEEAGFYDQHLGQPYLDEARVEILASPGQ